MCVFDCQSMCWFYSEMCSNFFENLPEWLHCACGWSEVGRHGQLVIRPCLLNNILLVFFQGKSHHLLTEGREGNCKSLHPIIFYMNSSWLLWVWYKTWTVRCYPSLLITVCESFMAEQALMLTCYCMRADDCLRNCICNTTPMSIPVAVITIMMRSWK